MTSVHFMTYQQSTFINIVQAFQKIYHNASRIRFNRKKENSCDVRIINKVHLSKIIARNSFIIFFSSFSSERYDICSKYFR